MNSESVLLDRRYIRLKLELGCKLQGNVDEKKLLSFKPFWYEKIKKGEKLFEYRKHFCNEPVMAITGIMMLGSRISLNEWKKEFENDEEVLARICDFSERNNYVMPILKFIPTTSITLKEIQAEIPSFIAPQMYYKLKENSDLLNLIETKLEIIEDGFSNSFDGNIKNKVCEKLT